VTNGDGGVCFGMRRRSRFCLGERAPAGIDARERIANGGTDRVDGPRVAQGASTHDLRVFSGENPDRAGTEIPVALCDQTHHVAPIFV
jgi:hypothetical protein